MDELDRLKWLSRLVLGKEVDPDSGEEKDVVQNAVYISMCLGAEWNYEFQWDVRKINSKTLNQDLFKLKEREFDYSPTEKDKEIEGRLRTIELLLAKFPSYNKRFDAYELLASTLFLRNTMTEPELISYLQKTKPWFDVEHLVIALNYAKTFHS
jgi:hypothetical protein